MAVDIGLASACKGSGLAFAPTKVRALILAAAIGLFPAHSNVQQRASNAQPLLAGKSVLIVYLSRTNNTKVVAELIQKQVGGILTAIELERPYPADYSATVEQVARENEANYLPPLKTRIDRIDQYDIVFIGFPTWGMQLPPPVKSFLRQHNLKGKTVIPFNTNAGYGEGSSFQTLRELCLGCNVLEGFVTKGGVERDRQFLVIQGAMADQVQKELERWLTKTSATIGR